MRVVWEDAARLDLLDIASCIAFENPSAADNVIDRVERQAEQLSIFPRRNVEVATGLYRAIVHGLPYVLRYMVEPDPLDPASEHVLIVSVRHMARRPDV